MPEMSLPRDVLSDVCAVCGFALYSHEVAGEIINGIAIDYNNRLTGRASMVFCTECWQQIAQHTNEDIEIAVARRQQLERDDYT